MQTRLNYLKTILPEQFLTGINEDYTDAYAYYSDQLHSLCLFKAGLAKAQADLYISSSSMTNESLPSLIDAKQERVSELIVNQNQFPILGYSYYEYSQALEETDADSSLLFIEYGLAFSDLSAYFPEAKERVSFNSSNTGGLIIVYLAGLFTGLFLYAWTARFRK